MSSLAERQLQHRVGALGWLRAAVLGANDGILTLASLVLGVATAAHGSVSLLVVGVAALISGAFAMSAGEYVSVKSQADFEAAELDIEREHLAADYDAEVTELAGIYAKRGLEPELAQEVARKLMAHDALGTHARDELGLGDALRAQPLNAAVSSGLSFLVGGSLPLGLALAAPPHYLAGFVVAGSLALLAVLGGLAALTAGAAPLRSAVRVATWGALSMAASAGLGLAIGATGFVG